MNTTKEERRRKLKLRIKSIFSTISFLILFSIILAILILLDNAGGIKLIIFVFLAYLTAQFWRNKEILKEGVKDILIKLFGG